MTNSLKIIMASSECIPFAKTGGLGDVTGTLPVFLKKLGHDIRVVIPMYSFIDIKKYKITPAIKSMCVEMAGEEIICSVSTTTINENVPIYFIDYKPYFERPNIYHDNDYNDYTDNPKRFTFLSKAALQLCHELNFKPNIVHANDWHTALLPAYLKTIYKNDPLFSKTASILTIHNLAYQGRYSHYYFQFSGLGNDDFTPDKFECHTAINFLKGGIHYADMVNTVSPGYASETLTPEGGFGMDPFLNKKGNNYVGILNGVDYSEWDPAKDALIPANYFPGDIKGKSVCKKSLQKRFGLNIDDKTPIIGIVSRLVEQKGFYILTECIKDLLNNLEVQFVILGAGDKQLESFFHNLSDQYPGKAGAFIGYSNELAHLIEAGSDFFLMPSLYEPCGLNQIYSLKYGTLPIVRATGGLNDTVENYNQETAEGTGFKFYEPSGKAIYNTISWALDTYYNRKNHIKKLIKNAMQQHYSWVNSAQEYIKLYNLAIKNMIMNDNK